MQQTRTNRLAPPARGSLRPKIVVTPTMEEKEDPGKVAETPVPAKFQIGCSDEDIQEPTDEEEEYRIIPPDGGWGWVVVAASFMCNAVVDGIIFTSGMLFPKLRETFGASNAEVAWISSLLGGFYLIVGPFVSALANAYGFRIVTILGAIVASVACGLSYFATSIYYLYVSFGILGGMGFGLIYVPAVISTGFYFERRRALATGIAVCGSGIGTFIMSPVNTYILANMGDQWQVIFLIYAGIVLSCALFGLAFRPLTAATGKKIKIDEDVDIAGTPLLIRIDRARKQELLNCPSALSMGSGFSPSPSKLTLEENQVMGNGEARNSIGSGALVARNLLDRHGGANANKRISVTGTLPILEEAEHHSDEDNLNTKVDQPQQQQLMMPSVTSRPSMQVGSTNSLTLLRNGGKCHLDDNKNETKKSYAIRYPRIESAPVLNARTNLLSVEPIDLRSRRASKISLRSEPRPFYRDDIFYSGSLARLSVYQSSETLGQYHASVLNIPPDALSASDSDGGYCCPPALRHVLTKMFDTSLLLSVTFVFLSVSGFLALMSLFVPFNFLPSYATDIGIEPGDASFIMSLIGICNTVGRIIAGWVSDHPKVDALLVNNLALIIGGAATIALPFLTNLSLLYLYAVLFGLAVAAFASLRSILLVELLGLEKLTNAFGLLLLFQGFAATFGSPIAGWFVDMTEQYKLSFYVFGGIFALSGILCIPLRKIKAWEDRRIDEKLRREKYGVT